MGATTINEAMKLECVRSIADLARAEQSDVVAQAYADVDLSFGPEYLIPKPFDPRLIVTVAPAVAKAAMDNGVATRPIMDFNNYRERLTQFIYHTGLIMRPVFERAKQAPKRVVYSEGEEERVLRGAGRGRRGTGKSLRHNAQDCAVVTQQFRQRRLRLGTQDARCPAAAR